VARLIRIAGASLLLGASSLIGAACGSGTSTALAKQACQHVNKSIALYNTITPSTPAPDAASIAERAQGELLKALPYAADATSGNGSLNALMTTIGEASRVPEYLLIPTLQSQCKSLQKSNPYNVQ
jgi:hypothetical protein